MISPQVFRSGLHAGHFRTLQHFLGDFCSKFGVIVLLEEPRSGTQTQLSHTEPYSAIPLVILRLAHSQGTQQNNPKTSLKLHHVLL